MAQYGYHYYKYKYYTDAIARTKRWFRYLKSDIRRAFKKFRLKSAEALGLKMFHDQTQAHINRVLASQTYDVRMFHMAFQYSNTTSQNPNMITISNKLVNQLETTSRN